MRKRKDRNPAKASGFAIWLGAKIRECNREMMANNIEERTVGLKVEYIEMTVPDFVIDEPSAADSAGKGGKGASQGKARRGG